MTLLVLLASGLAGLYAHWLKKWSRGQTKANFIDYMAKHRKHSIASVTALVAYVVNMYASVDVATGSQYSAMAFMAGYMIDSSLNKAPDEKP